MRGFKAYQIDTTSGPVPACRRRDYYTMYLLSDQRQLRDVGREAERDSTYLLLGAPCLGTASTWLSARQAGYGCLFTEAFAHACGLEGSRELDHLLNGRDNRIFLLKGPQAVYLTSLFGKMLAEQQSAYLFKHELLRSYLRLILHELLRLPTPARIFHCYVRLPGPASGVPRSIWRSRQRRLL